MVQIVQKERDTRTRRDDSEQDRRENVGALFGQQTDATALRHVITVTMTKNRTIMLRRARNSACSEK